MGLKKPAGSDAISLKWLQIFVRLVFKKSARRLRRILLVFQSVPLWSGKRRFGPFGINVGHFAGSSTAVAGFLKAYRQMVLLRPTVLFFSSPPDRSFLPPCCLFFSLAFPSLVWFWSLWGLRNIPFDTFSLKWLQISLSWFSKNWLDILSQLKESNRVWAAGEIYNNNKTNHRLFSYCSLIYENTRGFSTFDWEQR